MEDKFKTLQTHQLLEARIQSNIGSGNNICQYLCL